MKFLRFQFIVSCAFIALLPIAGSCTDPLARVALNHMTAKCEGELINDLRIGSVSHWGTFYLFMGLKGPFNVSLAVPKLEKGIYRAKGPGKGVAITLTDLRDLKKMKIYSMLEGQIEIRESDDVIAGLYNGLLRRSATEKIPIKGAFRFSRAIVKK